MSAKGSCFWTNINNFIGSFHNVFIMLYHNHRITQIS